MKKGGGRVFLPVKVKLSYDAASRSQEAQRHWRGADMLSADAALSPDIRKTIISRCRLEVANSPYAAGIVGTLADDTIGTGPRLLYHIDDYDDEKNTDQQKLQRRERRWRKWSKEILLSDKLKICRVAKARDGELFIQMVNNPKLKSHVKINISLFESEQCASELLANTVDYYSNGVPKEVDGILYDRYGNPQKYRFWRIHPGSNGFTSTLKSDTYLVPASSVIHYANIVRPGQHRGLPEMASSLCIFNDIRRYANAVIRAAESAADISFVLYTDIPPEESSYPDPRAAEQTKDRPFGFQDTVELNRNAGIALPEGWKASQLKAEQPTSTFEEFFDSNLNAAARPLSMPFNVAKGNSSGYNYASGRLDHQTYNRKIKTERSVIANTILDPLLEMFETVDRLFYPEDYRFDDLEISHEWMWDAFEHVDPTKETDSQNTRLHISGVSTLEEECAKEGKDYRQVLRQRARENKMLKEYGLEDKSELRKQHAADVARQDKNEEDKEPENATRNTRKRNTKRS